MAITTCLVVRTLSLPTQRLLRVSWEIRVSSNPHWLYSLPLGPRRRPHCRHVTAHLHQSLANPSRKCRKALTSDTPGEAPATMCPPLLHVKQKEIVVSSCHQLPHGSSLFVAEANLLNLPPGSMKLLFPSILRRPFQAKSWNLVEHQMSRESGMQDVTEGVGLGLPVLEGQPAHADQRGPQSYFRDSGLISVTCNRALSYHYLGGHHRSRPCVLEGGVDKSSGRARCAGSMLGLQRCLRTILLNWENLKFVI